MGGYAFALAVTKGGDCSVLTILVSDVPVASLQALPSDPDRDGVYAPTSATPERTSQASAAIMASSALSATRY
jgi:hypothetical protein